MLKLVAITVCGLGAWCALTEWLFPAVVGMG